MGSLFMNRFVQRPKVYGVSMRKKRTLYKKVLILDKMVQINLKSSLEVCDKMKRE